MATSTATASLVPLPAAGEGHWRYAGWKVALASSAGVFCWSLHPYSFAVFLKPLTEEFGWTRQMVAGAFGLSALMAAALSTPAGLLMDRVGARVVLIPALTGAGLVFLLRGFVTGPFWHLAALFALSGVCGQGANPVAHARLVSTWFDGRRGRALGVVMAGVAAGAMAHPVVGQLLIDGVGWRAAQVVLGVLMLTGVPIVAAFVRARPDTPRAGGPHVAGMRAPEALRTRVFLVLAAVLLCDALATGSLTVHLPALLTDRGVDAPTAALTLSAMGAAALVGRLGTGSLLDRFFAPYISIALLVLAAAGLLVLATAESRAAGILGAACVGLGMGGESDVTPYLLTRYFGLRAFATIYGVMFTITAVAWAVGPTLMGRAFDADGTYAPHLVRLAALLGGAALLMLSLPRYARAGQE
ncbi:MAG: MFS transporter [Vicinamibacterales bacterium]